MFYKCKKKKHKKRLIFLKTDIIIKTVKNLQYTKIGGKNEGEN